ncbi:MAG: family 10 glycosylhydrolase [Parafilimonas sp.]
MPHALLRRAFAAIAALLILIVSPVRAQEEVRALWVVRTTLASPSAISTMVAAAKHGGFNTLLVQVRGRGDAYFQQGIEPRPELLAAQPAFDPLATVIAKGHEAGLQVHAWINVNLIAGAADLPAARDHIAYRHPEWLMVPRALAVELSTVDPRSPGYVGRLARYARAQSAEIKGLYLSPVTAESTAYTTSVVRDLAQRYDIDGVHLDYLRYPSSDFDYSRETLVAFGSSIVPDLSVSDVRRYDAEAAAGDPLIYSQAFPERWRGFRVAPLTALLTSLRAVVKTVRPAARPVAGAHPLWVGIGAFRLSSEQIMDNVQTARRLNVGGIILFSYDSVAESKNGPGYVAQVGRTAFQF